MSPDLQAVYFRLQILQKLPGVRAVHLRVMELKRNGQIISDPFLFISSPNEKRVVENTAVSVDRAVKFGVDDGGRSNNHAVLGKRSVLTELSD